MSVREALRKVPGLHVVDEDAFGLNLNVGMRGLTARRAQRVLLLEDGMPIHLGPYSDPSAHYHPPVDALARIEVVKGASQVAFGPQTVGGVVNLVRRAPPDVPAARIALGGGSAGYATGRLSAGGRWDGRGLLLDVGRREGDGTRRGHHHRVDDVALRADVPLAGTQRLALSLGHYREASRYGEAGLSQVEFERDPYGNPLPHDVFDLTRQGAQLVHETTPRPGVRLRTQAYAQRVARTAWRQASTSRDRPGNAAWERAFGCPAGITSVDACGNTGRPRRYAFAGLEPRLSVAHALLGAEGALEAGVRAHAEHMRRQERAGATATARTGPLTRDNAVTTRAASLFVQERLRVGAWTLVPGVRLEHVRSRNHNVLASTRGHDAYTELLPGLGATWAPSSGRADGTTLFAGVHRGFAPPRPADVLDPQPGQGIVQVDAEHSWTSELGARARLGRWGQVEATAFRLDFANQIVRGSLVGAGQRYVNAGRTRHQGVELAGSVALDRAAEGAWPAAAARSPSTCRGRGSRWRASPARAPARPTPPAPCSAAACRSPRGRCSARGSTGRTRAGSACASTET
jgi:Fe(3+) dicitrate transport protein